MHAGCSPCAYSWRCSGMTRGTDGRTLFTIAHVSKAFGGVRALSDLSLEVSKGEIRAIIGPNGAGKTTLINLISRVYLPDQGQIIFAGRDLAGLPTHKIAAAGIGRTFQNIALCQRPVPMVGREAMLTPIHVAPELGKAVFSSRSRLDSVSNVRAGAESRSSAVASV